MSKQFIESKVNSNSLDTATRQYQQLYYFTTSEVQKNANESYFNEYIDRKYYTSDVFLNWVKSIFKDANFLTFVKYFRNPNPSSELINTKIKEPLSRVFFSEDSHFNYLINGKDSKKPIEVEDGFEKSLFEAVLFQYNDIIVHDLSDINKPYRDIISIDKIVSIEERHGEILKIAYTAKIKLDKDEEVRLINIGMSDEISKDGYIYGYAYIDDKNYEFYSKDFNLIKSVPHDLGKCPAVFVTARNFGKDNIVKESVFSYLRSHLEEYCFLKTLQRMVNANGTVPIMVKIKTNEQTQSSDDFDNRSGEPMSSLEIGSQVSSQARSTAGSGVGDILQAGTSISVPPIEKNDGSIDTDLAKNFLNFHYTPVEALKFLDDRIKELEVSIVLSSVGDSVEKKSVEGSKSDAEIESVTIASKQDKLRWLSKTMSSTREKSDQMLLSLKYGAKNVKVDVFYGSDFFIESQDRLYELYKKAPNSVERTNILVRLSQRRNMFNKEKAKREWILYHLMPYTSDKDFETALSREGVVSNDTFVLQTQFSYWIASFEAMYGNIVIFWKNLGDMKDSEKILLINKLILNLIQNENGRETNS